MNPADRKTSMLGPRRRAVNERFRWLEQRVRIEFAPRAGSGFAERLQVSVT